MCNPQGTKSKRKLKTRLYSQKRIHQPILPFDGRHPNWLLTLRAHASWRSKANFLQEARLLPDPSQGRAGWTGLRSREQTDAEPCTSASKESRLSSAAPRPARQAVCEHDFILFHPLSSQRRLLHVNKLINKSVPDHNTVVLHLTHQAIPAARVISET